MKVALVKQVLDLHGPWAPVAWSEAAPDKLAEVWPTRALLYELTCLLQADWYIVEQSLDNEYLAEAVHSQPGRADMIRANTKGVVQSADLDLSAYDLVITADPVLLPEPGHRAVFAYFVNEHWDSLY